MVGWARLKVLTATGHNDIAYKLLQNDTFPSWDYSIRQGATTIWERWNGYTKDKGFQDPGMNSFTHYSLGSVGQWMYQSVAGIDTDPAQPGYKHLLMHPHPGPGLTFAGADYDMPYGKAASHWKTAGGQVAWTLTIPANTTATVWVPTSKPAAVMDNGRKAATAPGITALRTEPGAAIYEVQAGTYQFTAPLTR